MGLDERVFLSEFLEDDLERLRRFLAKWRLDFGLGSCLKLNGMIEVVGNAWFKIRDLLV